MSLEVRDVGVVHDVGTPWAHPALDGVSLRAEAGDRLVVVGHNGAGKSTLAWVLAGATSPTSGTATLDGSPLTDRAGDIGFVIQHTRLQLQRPTVGAELAAHDLRPPESFAALAAVGLDRRLVARRIEELSVGQQRRVALGIALAARPRLLVLDEPLAGLDRDGVEVLLRALAAVPASTIVVTVTHELDDWRRLGDRRVELRRGRVEVGT